MSGSEDETGFNPPVPGLLDYLRRRRSGSAKAMTGPGPSRDQLEAILAAAARVPDHGKLFPWRFLVIEGEARLRLGEAMAAIFARRNPEAITELVDAERRRFARAPVVAAVISTAKPGLKIPEWEQILSAGAVCQTLLIAAHAAGFAANWLTEWMAYDEEARGVLGMAPGERVAGFIYIGTNAKVLDERPRPDLGAIVTRWGG
jgi:nitroreductase